MTTLSLRFPESIHRKLAELAKAEGVSLNQLLSSAAAEKLAALMTEEYLAERAKRASRRKFDAVLANWADK
jgi:post-segregation antitoxin (ccd killing protein)